MNTTLSFNDKIHKAIERLLRTSGYNDWNIISVVDEAKFYCYKTIEGKIGVVEKNFLNNRIKSNLF